MTKVTVGAIHQESKVTQQKMAAEGNVGALTGHKAEHKLGHLLSGSTGNFFKPVFTPFGEHASFDLVKRRLAYLKNARPATACNTIENAPAKAQEIVVVDKVQQPKQQPVPNKEPQAIFTPWVQDKVNQAYAAIARNDKAKGIITGVVNGLITPVVANAAEQVSFERVKGRLGTKFVLEMRKDFSKNYAKNVYLRPKIKEQAAKIFSDPLFVEFISNAGAGVGMSVLATPLSNIKTEKMHSHRHHHTADRPYLNETVYKIRILGPEGIGKAKALMQGVGATTLANLSFVPLFFGTSAYVRQRFLPSCEHEHALTSFAKDAVVGLTVGEPLSAMAYPLCIIAKHQKNSKTAVTAFEVAKEIVALHGVRGLWSGFPKTLVGTGISVIGMFACSQGVARLFDPAKVTPKPKSSVVIEELKEEQPAAAPGQPALALPLPEAEPKKA